MTTALFVVKVLMSIKYNLYIKDTLILAIFTHNWDRGVLFSKGKKNVESIGNVVWGKKLVLYINNFVT